MGTSKSMILSAAFDLKSLNPILPQVRDFKSAAQAAVTSERENGDPSETKG